MAVLNSERAATQATLAWVAKQSSGRSFCERASATKLSSPRIYLKFKLKSASNSVHLACLRERKEHPPLLECMHHRQQFLFVYGVILFGGGHEMRLIGDGGRGLPFLSLK
ncbi:hypothetical protein PCASD_22383 [Puccinia coronata f. sp. avenae]|uniref:Uncharacterized protein n=1 Tax=Puccinia coronata f. sp. avenae TaxID=200324 RepID=A0A2N5SEZ5_9BASI|nr:hypothetical protein PCASD_22383 [Puccinia coronata f. sp. avenae]